MTDSKALRKGRSRDLQLCYQQMLFNSVLMIQCNKHVLCSIYIPGAVELSKEPKMSKT